MTDPLVSYTVTLLWQRNTKSVTWYAENFFELHNCSVPNLEQLTGVNEYCKNFT